MSVFYTFELNLGIHKLRWKSLVHQVDFQRKTVRQLIDSPHLLDQRLADHVPKLAEFIFGNLHLNLLPRQTPGRFNAQDMLDRRACRIFSGISRPPLLAADPDDRNIRVQITLLLQLRKKKRQLHIF